MRNDVTASAVTRLLGHPELLDRSTLYTLRGVVARYPCFSAARLLLLFNLWLLREPDFGPELRRSVFFVADRRALWRFVNGLSATPVNSVAEEKEVLHPVVENEAPVVPAAAEDVPVSPVAEHEAPVAVPVQPVAEQDVSIEVNVPVEPEPTVDRTLALINDFLSALPAQPATSSTIFDHPATVDYMATLAASHGASSESRKHDAADSSTVKEIMEPTEKTPAETSATSFVPAKDEKAEAPIPTDTASAAADDENAPQSSAEDADSADSSTPVEPQFLTETLAQIYIRQKKYDRALEIIRSLNLHYPEKSIYFADQIRFLEKLVRNNRLKNS